MSQYDVGIEKTIIKHLLQNKNFLRTSIMYQRVLIDHFADLFHRDVFRSVKYYYEKHGHPPEEKHLKRVLPHFISYQKKFKTKEKQKEIWLKAVEKLYIPLTDSQKDVFSSDIEALEDFRKARLLQKTILDVEDMYEDGKYGDAFNLLSERSVKSRIVEVNITEGEITSDIDQHLTLMELAKSGEIKPFQTNIKGVQEDLEGEWKLISLDSCLGEGLYKQETTLLVGENNIGKSFGLMELCYNIAKFDKKNVILFTIEVSKVKQERRIYSRLTGIPYSRFRNYDLTKKQISRWKRKVSEWKEKCGKFIVVAFDQGARPSDIENKLKDIENQYGEPFEFIAIDYLNDMLPDGGSQDRDWTTYGDISWNLHNLAKHHNNHQGIHIATANQKKTTSKDHSMSWQDAAFSALPTQHSDIGIGIYQNEEKGDKEYNRIRWKVWKNRDGEKGQEFLTYPNFKVARINSLKRIYEFYDEE